MPRSLPPLGANASTTQLITAYNQLAEWVQTGIPSKVGAPVDADFAHAVDGLMAIDSSTNRLYVRVAGTWRYTALT